MRAFVDGWIVVVIGDDASVDRPITITQTSINIDLIGILFSNLTFSVSNDIETSEGRFFLENGVIKIELFTYTLRPPGGCPWLTFEGSSD